MNATLLRQQQNLFNFVVIIAAPIFCPFPFPPPRRSTSLRRLPWQRPLPPGMQARGRGRGRLPPLLLATPQRTNALAICGRLCRHRCRRGGDDDGCGSPRSHFGLIEMMCYLTEMKFDAINSYVFMYGLSLYRARLWSIFRSQTCEAFFILRTIPIVASTVCIKKPTYFWIRERERKKNWKRGEAKRTARETHLVGLK